VAKIPGILKIFSRQTEPKFAYGERTNHSASPGSVTGEILGIREVENHGMGGNVSTFRHVNLTINLRGGLTVRVKI
jgi:hypothetical protein